VDFNITDQLLFRHYASVRYWRKKWEYNGRVHQLFIDYDKVYDSVRREVLYNILIASCIPMELVRLIKMCLNETYVRFCIGRNFSDAFPLQNGLKQEDALLALPFNFALEYATKGPKKSGRTRIDGTFQLLVYADSVNTLGENTNTVKQNREALLEASREAGLEANTEKTKYMVVS
jgi:hypothetical protein